MKKTTWSPKEPEDNLDQLVVGIGGDQVRMNQAKSPGLDSSDPFASQTELLANIL